MSHTAELREPERELLFFRRRLMFAFVLVLVAFATLIGRFVYLQVVKREHFQTLAESNRISIVPVVPNRGIISDRNGVVLAHNYSAYTLEITPSKIRALEALIDDLATIVDVSPRDRKRFRKLLEESKNFESLPLRTRLSDDEVARFAAAKYRFPGVEIKARLFRQYPYGEVASHVVGYISRINQKDLDRIEEWEETANYKGSDYIGKVGIELAYERELHGATGVEQVEVDSGGRAVRTLSRSAPTPGNNLRLSIDIRLQQVAEEAFGERRGALVAIEPGSGDVLAFVSKPGYDPNLFVDGIDPQNWEALNGSPDRPLLNRPLRGAYPPGSTYKPFMALAGLTMGKRTPAQAISDPGFFVLAGGHRFRDDKVGGHGMVDLYKSIVVSCDTYYYQLASEFDIDDLHDFMRQFGLGQITGIDIEGELPGVLPSRAWKRKRFSGAQYREEHRKWYLGDNISVGIGQGYNAFTPLQMAQATAIVAGDGANFQPRLVMGIENSRTGEVSMVARPPGGRVNVSSEHLAIVRNAMVGVNKEGTATRAFAGVKYVAGGKTGTAQVFSQRAERYEAAKIDERLRDHSWFIAYAPADRPRIALAVLVENGGFGSQSAAPIARKVLDYFLLGTVPERAAQSGSAPGTGPGETPADPEDESD